MPSNATCLGRSTAASGKAAAFEAAQKDYCAAVLRCGAPQCLVFSPTTLSPGGLFFTLLRFSSFSHYDEGTYTSKGLAPEQAAELESRRGPTVAGNRESALTLHAEMSYTSSDPGNLVIFTDFAIRSGSLSSPRRRASLRCAPGIDAAVVLEFNPGQLAEADILAGRGFLKVALTAVDEGRGVGK